MPIRATHSYAERSDLAGDLAWSIANQLLAAVEERGMARLAVSGGGTPKLLFSMLSDIDLPWEAVHVTLVDDRCVPPEHGHSNVALVREFLMQGKAANAVLEPLFDPTMSEADCARALSQNFSPSDALVLGMGPDSHTASLFPRSPQLGDGLFQTEPAFIVSEPTMEPMVTRLTMNKAAIDAAAWCVLHIEGAGKRDIFERAKAPDADPLLSPITAFLNDPHADIEVYWAP